MKMYDKMFKKIYMNFIKKNNKITSSEFYTLKEFKIQNQILMVIIN